MLFTTQIDSDFFQNPFWQFCTICTIKFTFHWHLPQKSLSREFLSQQRIRCGPSSLSSCGHTEKTKCVFLFSNTFFDHLKYFQEEVNVKSPDAKALSNDGKQEGDADDEEDGGEQDVDGGENQKLQKHYHL